jgi:hypothetical protein
VTHAIHRVEGFEIVDPYTLALRFEDGTQREYVAAGVLAF